MRAKICGSSSPLQGVIQINGSKNAALPIMAACLLTSEPVTLQNIPNILDVRIMCDILRSLGASVDFNINSSRSGHSIKIKMNDLIRPSTLEMGSKLRASFVTVGPLLSRYGSAILPPVGGCNIGERSVDIHLKAFQQMGASLTEDSKEIRIPKPRIKLKGAVIHLVKPSVGATENLLMAATLAEGTTIIKNAAMEPDVVDLARFLCKMGAKIQGIGQRTVIIEGVSQLHGCEYSIISDVHEAGTYALAAVITNGVLELKGVSETDFKPILKEFENIGGQIMSKTPNSVIVRRKLGCEITATDIITNPYPKFPTDMQAPFCTVLCLARGSSTSENISYVHDNVFENRFQHVDQLRKMGANIEMFDAINNDQCGSELILSNKKMLLINGMKSGFQGETVQATDLRASVALVLAGLVASGETIIENIEHLLRGYEDMDWKLNSCGANFKII